MKGREIEKRKKKKPGVGESPQDSTERKVGSARHAPDWNQVGCLSDR